MKLLTDDQFDALAPRKASFARCPLCLSTSLLSTRPSFFQTEEREDTLEAHKCRNCTAIFVLSCTRRRGVIFRDPLSDGQQTAEAL